MCLEEQDLRILFMGCKTLSFVLGGQKGIWRILLLLGLSGVVSKGRLKKTVIFTACLPLL